MLLTCAPSAYSYLIYHNRELLQNTIFCHHEKPALSCFQNSWVLEDSSYVASLLIANPDSAWWLKWNEWVK